MDENVYDTPTIDEVPQTLFRYYGVSGKRFEYLRQAIVKTEIYFSEINRFNDPFDCRFQLQFKERSGFLPKKFWRNEAPRRTGSKAGYERAIRGQIAKTRTAAGRHELFETFYETVVQSMGVLCLSTVETSVLMWSYYAEGHRGVVLRFDTSDRMLQQMAEFLPMPVRYAKVFPVLDYYATDLIERCRTVFGTKSIEWKHEKEWRLISKQGSGSYPLDPRFITGLIFGMNIDPDHERQIREFVKERPAPIPLFRVQNKSGTFELEVMPVEEGRPKGA